MPRGRAPGKDWSRVGQGQQHGRGGGPEAVGVAGVTMGQETSRGRSARAPGGQPLGLDREDQHHMLPPGARSRDGRQGPFLLKQIRTRTHC